MSRSNCESGSCYPFMTLPQELVKRKQAKESAALFVFSSEVLNDLQGEKAGRFAAVREGPIVQVFELDGDCIPAFEVGIDGIIVQLADDTFAVNLADLEPDEFGLPCFGDRSFDGERLSWLALGESGQEFRPTFASLRDRRGHARVIVRHADDRNLPA